MRKIKARKLHYCNGNKGCNDPIYCGQMRYPLRRSKSLCESCGDKRRASDNGVKSWLTVAINKFYKLLES